MAGHMQRFAIGEYVDIFGGKRRLGAGAFIEPDQNVAVVRAQDQVKDAFVPPIHHGDPGAE
jgi:hypothetical protein